MTQTNKDLSHDKNFDIKFHYSRQLNEYRAIKLECRSSNKMHLFTKPLPNSAFQKLRDELQLKTLSASERKGEF